jgi:hypothetical protein
MTKQKKKRQNVAGDSTESDSAKEASPSAYTWLHLLIGWWSLLVFLSLGIGLEYMHAFRVRAYVDLGEPEVRRLMWTLAHAHGVLISVVHLGFAFTVYYATEWNSRAQSLASSCLIAAGLFMPLGFFLGGLFVYDGDPGLGVYLVPPGALLLFIAVLLTGVGVFKARR